MKGNVMNKYRFSTVIESDNQSDAFNQLGSLPAESWDCQQEQQSDNDQTAALNEQNDQPAA
jgi:hypothetical protein